jgi:hypothetical protein
VKAINRQHPLLPAVASPAWADRLTSHRLPAVWAVCFFLQGAAVERLLSAEGDAAGSEFRQEPGVGRLAALVGKDAVFEQLVTHEGVLSYVASILGATRLKLSSVNGRVVPPTAPGVGSSESAAAPGLQPLHADFSAVADADGPWVANVLVALAPCKPTNPGPTQCVCLSAV